MKNTRTIIIASTLALVTFIILALFFFEEELNSHKNLDIHTRMQESVQPQVVSFELQMREQIKKVKTFADFLGDNWSMQEEVKVSLLNSAVKNNGLLRCAIAFPDGSFITHDNINEGNVAADPFFQANMRGDFYITDPRPAVVDATKTVILFAAPIFDANNRPIGSIIYSYLCNDLDSIFNLESMDGELGLVVIKGSGELLIGNTPFVQSQGNLIAALSQSCTHATHKGFPCLDISQSRGMQRITHPAVEGALYVLYEKLDFNDWYMIATISEAAASASIAFAKQNQSKLGLVLAGGALVYFSIFALLWVWKRKRIDPATGICTLYAFKQKSKKIFKARKSEQYVVVMLDVKDFKLINRIHSFAAGDRVIWCVAQSLALVLDTPDSALARVNVDTFVLLLPYGGRQALGAKRQAFIHSFREMMHENFAAKIVFPTGQYVLKPTDFPKPDIDDIFEKVNFAHRAAKQDADDIIDYQEDIENTALFVKTVEDRMEDAIKAKEFTLYLQPKIRIADESICGAEALVRWKIGDKFYMYPTDFIPVLEKNGFIVQLDFYMFECATQFLAQCIVQNITPIPISVNFARHHLTNPHLIRELCAIADTYHVPHHLLEIEVTESAFLGHIQDMQLLIQSAHEAGFLFAMDDFGSGYSSLALLKDLPVDVLKIDSAFFAPTQDPQRAATIIAGILYIANKLNITTVAEGIEELSQVEMLKGLGCDIIQGYIYARPMPAQDLDMTNLQVHL